ncbi:unnamed protein product [Coregonus sp. 'balchen']|nr:unnamed protein product [Coregonus sp. 'balchen']
MRAKGAEMPGKDCVKVAVRVRPFNKRERDAGSHCIISMASSTITIQDPRNSQSPRSFCFDYAYWSHSGFTRDRSGLYVPEEPGGRYADQGSVFQDLGEGILENALQGYNATLLAYGQTGSGKSYSMVGYGPNKGLVPTLCDRLFQAIRANQDSRQCQVFFSMLEIYNEQVVDLLSRGSRSPGGLRVREEQQRGFYIFSKESITKQSNINLVDLAGSERQRVSGSEADRLKEGTAINLSLTTLGNVISALADVANAQIAALSPADICYEESISTLRYAERAKRIQNRAVVNESPTERLVKELKAENARLLQRLSRLGQEGRRAEDETKELRRLLTHNELQIRAIQTLWEQHLQEALKDWEQQYATITQERRMMQMHPYILNINEDTQLSGVVKLFIQEGEWDIGLSDSSPRSISVRGLGIQERHAVFINVQRRVYLTPLAGSKVIVNGTPISQKTELQHLDRLILGSNSTYLFIGYPSERGGDDWSRYDYDYFHAVPSQTDPSLLAGVEFKLEIKNLALSDSKGHDLEKDITVRVTSLENKQVWLWSKAKFVNRKFLMEELYQQHHMEQKREGAARAPMPRDRDPFWDPLEPLLLGSAHLWLQSLAFRIALEEQLELVLDQCCGLRWVKQARNRGVQIGFRMFDSAQPLYTPAVWHNVNPLLDQRVHFTSLHTSQGLLEHLQTSALVLELWGLQVRMTPEGCFIIDQAGPPDTATTVDPGSELSCSLRALQQDFARALKVFYHSMTSVRVQLQRLRRHRPSEESDLLGLRLFVDEQGGLLRDFSELLEQSVSSLKQDVAAIVRRKRERSGIWS